MSEAAHQTLRGPGTSEGRLGRSWFVDGRTPAPQHDARTVGDARWLASAHFRICVVLRHPRGLAVDFSRKPTICRSCRQFAEGRSRPKSSRSFGSPTSEPR